MAYPTIRKGSTGEYVKIVQRKLSLKVDGIFGTVTENAVKTFQRSKGLTADGVVGPKTWTAMGYPQGSTPINPPGDATRPGGNNQVIDGGASGTAISTVVTNPLNMIIGGVLLYGLFKVFMKIF